MDAAEHGKYEDRAHAGAVLGMNLALALPAADYIVLGLLRGGVPIAAGVAQSLGSKLGVLAVKKLGVPSNQELAFGAIARYRGELSTYFNPDIHRRSIRYFGADELERVELDTDAKLKELAKVYDVYTADLQGRDVILCDDGIATGTTMFAALELVSKHEPASITVALPVGPANLLPSLKQQCDEVFLLWQPQNFTSVGAHYVHFEQVSQVELNRYLQDAA